MSQSYIDPATGRRVRYWGDSPPEWEANWDLDPGGPPAADQERSLRTLREQQAREAPMPVTAYLCPRCDTPYRYEDEAEQCCQGTAA